MFVYFMKCLSYVKIGYTTSNLYHYRSQKQNANPFKIKYVGLIPCNSEQEMKEKEDALQEKFKHLKHRNEWFHGVPELLNYIEDHAKKPDSYVNAAYEEKKASDRRQRQKRKAKNQ